MDYKMNKAEKAGTDRFGGLPFVQGCRFRQASQANSQKPEIKSLDNIPFRLNNLRPS